MSKEDRIQALRQRHAALDAQIEEENQRPHPDDDRITQLKRQKLRIKDEIVQISSQLDAQ